jgi:uncharacterized protein (DUF58 family)
MSFHPTRRALLAFLAGGLLAVGAVVVAPGLWPWWLAFVLTAALAFALDVAIAPRLARVSVRPELPAELAVGVPHEAALVLQNDSGRALTVRLHVDVTAPLAEVPAREGLALPPGPSRVPLRLHAGRRGTAHLDALWLGARGPLGLAAFRREVALDRPLRVGPNVRAASEHAAQLFSTQDIHVGLRVERHRGDGSEFDHLREYAPGFDIRSIDWKASARHARLLVRETRAERNRQVVLAIDSGRLMAEPLDGVPRLDHAVTAALTLAYVSLHVGDRVGLASFDDRLRQYCPPGGGTASIAALRRSAGDIDYSTAETNFTLGLMELQRRQTRRALVVVLTDFVDTVTAELMVENVTRLSRRHVVVFVALQDPLLQAVADRRPDDVGDLHRAVVAHSLLRDRELVLRRLARLGILCVDAPPRLVSAQLIDRYLYAKRKELF